MLEQAKQYRSERRGRDRNRLGCSSLTGRPFVAGLLVDISPGGLGLETAEKFDRGDIVEIHGVLLNSSLGLRFDGHARIAYSRGVGPRRYRVGLKFLEVTRTPLTSSLKSESNGARQSALPDFGIIQICRLD